MPSPDPPPQTAPILLPELLDLTRADALQALLQAGLEQANSLALDGSHVEIISTACLQVLVASATTANARGGSQLLARPSPVLRAAATDLGLGAALALEAA